MKGPVQDTRVDAITPGVEMVVHTRITASTSGVTNVLFVGRYDYIPGNHNDLQRVLDVGSAITWVRYSSGEVALGGAQQLAAPHNLFAFLQDVPPTAPTLRIGGPENQAWHGPMAAVLLGQEPTTYQAARLVQALARTL